MHTDMHIHACMFISHAPLIIYLCWKWVYTGISGSSIMPARSYLRVFVSLIVFMTPSSHTELLCLPDCTHYSVSSSCVSSASWRCGFSHHADVALPSQTLHRCGCYCPPSAGLPDALSCTVAACARVPPSRISSATWNFTFLLNRSARNKKWGRGKDSRFLTFVLWDPFPVSSFIYFLWMNVLPTCM